MTSLYEQAEHLVADELARAIEDVAELLRTVSPSLADTVLEAPALALYRSLRAAQATRSDEA